MLKVIAAAGLLSGTAEGLGSGSAHHESRFAQVAQSLSKDQLAHDAGRLHRPVHPSRGNPSVWFQEGFYADAACTQLTQAFGIITDRCIPGTINTEFRTFVIDDNGGSPFLFLAFYTDSECTQYTYSIPVFPELGCTEVAPNVYNKLALVDTILDQDRYVDGILMSVSASSTFCTLDNKDNEAGINEYAFVGINDCLSSMFYNSDVSPTYCSGNQVTFVGYTYTCGGSISVTFNTFASSNCQGDGSDLIIGMTSGYGGFICAAASSDDDDNNEARKHSVDANLFETNEVTSSYGNLNAEGSTVIASMTGVVAAVVAAAIVIFKRSRSSTDFEELKNEASSHN